MAAATKRAVARLIAEHPGATVVWTVRWQGPYYHGTDTREYPAHFGSGEIMRQIRNERADRRSTGRILSETIATLGGYA